MILELYRQLKEIADNEFNEIIEDSQIITSYTGRARKLRLNRVFLSIVRKRIIELRKKKDE